MRVVIKLDYPPKCGRYSDNQYYKQGHWSKRDTDARYWHQRMLLEAPWNRPPLKKPVEITFLWNDRLDLSNHGTWAKMLEDGIKGRIIKDDSRKYVVGINHKWHNENNIKIIIEEVAE